MMASEAPPGAVAVPRTATETDIAATEVKGLVNSFLGLQRQRVQVYQAWQSAFSQFLRDQDLPPYQEAVRVATGEFARLSQLVNDIRAAFLTLDSSLHQSVSDLQRLEKRKLELTVAMQLLKKATTVDTPSDERPDPVQLREYSEAVQELQQVVESLNDVQMEIQYAVVEQDDDM